MELTFSRRVIRKKIRIMAYGEGFYKRIDSKSKAIIVVKT